MGATIFLMPSIYKSVFDSMGLKLEDCFQSIPLNTLYKIYFEDGTTIPFSSDQNVMQTELESREAGSYDKARQYTKTGYELFNLAMERLMNRNFYKLTEFITFKNVILLLKLKTYLRHMTYVKRFFRHPHLRTTFTFQNIYVGQNPYKAPALFTMIPASEMTEGALFPIGGMYKLTETLILTAEKLGVKFFYGKPVTKIEIRDNLARGIVLDDGTVVEADLVIANADLPYVYRDLLPDKNISKRIDRLKFGCSALVIHWGLDKVYQQLGHHSVFIAENFRSSLNHVFRHKSLSGNPSFYIHAPARTDKTAAPAGGDTLSIIVPAGHLDETKPQNWNELRQTARLAVINRLKKAGLEDIEDHIKFEISFTPEDWKKVFNLTRGATFGLGHTIFQMGYFRPHNRHKRYKNLYFTGGNTHPGNGVPLVLLSARLTAERILKENC
jgi:phytoene desaturase